MDLCLVLVDPDSLHMKVTANSEESLIDEYGRRRKAITGIIELMLLNRVLRLVWKGRIHADDEKKILAAYGALVENPGLARHILDELS